MTEKEMKKLEETEEMEKEVELTDDELEEVAAGASPYVKKKLVKEVKKRFFD